MKPQFDTTAMRVRRHSSLASLVAGLFASMALLSAVPADAQQILSATGPAYFWTPGSPDWQPVVLNTLMNPGDALYDGDGATTEVLIGPNDYARLSSRSQLRLLALDSGLEQFYVDSGIVSFDLRSMPLGQIVAVDTPNASLVLGGAGYYRVDVQPNQTRFMTRRGGTATLTTPGGGSRTIIANQEIVVVGADQPVMQYRVLPVADPWDRWNDSRSDYYATAGLGIVWIDINRREHRHLHRDWERRDIPAPPGGWVREHRPASTPVIIPTPLPMPRPVRPPDVDHDRGDRDHRDGDRPRFDNERGGRFEDRRPPVERPRFDSDRGSRVEERRPGEDRGRIADERGQHRPYDGRIEQPAPSVNVIIRPSEPVAQPVRQAPPPQAAPVFIAPPPRQAPVTPPPAAAIQSPAPTRNATPMPAPAPQAGQPQPRMQVPERDEHRHHRDHEER